MAFPQAYRTLNSRPSDRNVGVVRGEGNWLFLHIAARNSIAMYHVLGNEGVVQGVLRLSHCQWFIVDGRRQMQTCGAVLPCRVAMAMQ